MRNNDGMNKRRRKRRTNLTCGTLRQTADCTWFLNADGVCVEINRSLYSVLPEAFSVTLTSDRKDEKIQAGGERATRPLYSALPPTLAAPPRRLVRFGCPPLQTLALFADAGRQARPPIGQHAPRPRAAARQSSASPLAPPQKARASIDPSCNGFFFCFSVHAPAIAPSCWRIVPSGALFPLFRLWRSALAGRGGALALLRGKEN